MTKSSWSQRAFIAAIAALLAFSVGWVWHVGHRGLFLLDQSIVFDGAWRLVQGQVPYRDFYLPFGPITFVLPALVFRFTGATFSGLVAAACLLSLLATAVALRLTTRLTGSRALALLAGTLTAAWFQAPFGVPWMEQTAFFFDLLALYCIVESRFAPRGKSWLVGVSGMSSALAVLSKQNAGGLFVFVCLGCLLLTERRRSWRELGAYALGGCAVAASFAAWLVARSDPANFLHYWLEVSAETGISRIETWKLVGTVFFQTLVSSSVPLFLLTSLVGAAALCLAHRSREPVRPEIALCAWLSLALPQFHNAFQLTTNNDAANNNAFVGVCLAAGLFLAGEARRWLCDQRRQGELAAALRDIALGWPGRALALVIAGFTLYSLSDGLMVARDRNVQEFFGARFDTPVAAAGASRVVWGEPTRITPNFCGNIGEMCRLSDAEATGARSREFLERSDFEALVAELRRRQENIFVFPDATMLYGLTGHISPQPLLYFHAGQSFLPEDRDRLDHEITQALQKNKVEVVVLERASFMGTHRQLVEFPRLNAWLQRDFESVRELGNYRVLELRRERSPVAAN